MRGGGARVSLVRVRGRVRRPVRGRWKWGRLAHAAGRGDVVSRNELLSVRGHTVAWLVPLVLLAGIAAADITTDVFQIIAWTVLVPGVAAAICSVRVTAVFAVLAVVVYMLADLVWKHRDETGLPGLMLVVVGGGVAVVAAAVRVGGERRMLHMRDIAETTRRTVLRQLPAGFGGLEHGAVYLAADSEARVGGDFYDIQPGPHGTRVLLGDVQGKGLGAVDAAAALLGTFREAAFHEPDLAVVAGHLEMRMLRHRAHTAALGRADGDRFATAVLVGFRGDLPDAVEVVVFGHEPPLAVGPRGVRSLPVGGGLPLGMSDLLPGPVVSVNHAPLPDDESLLLVTDGVTEARDPGGRFYRYGEAVARAVGSDVANAAPQRLVTLVRDGTLRHCRGRLADDTTVFAVRRAGLPPKWP
ncbi:PP2C family protein-serine/threonine phosphatase [Streptomyces parvulus]|uniref:PP2C family protein-serine/threonine phosphatase n=1 Tax=Streptomyces parvulus TaxID=146923 RepID=UPI0015F035B9|nr:PP2C family protein-serine/threonine phosphatase [Streptomyces parvulus]